MKINFICKNHKDVFAKPIISQINNSQKLIKIENSIYKSKLYGIFCAIFAKNIWIEWASNFAIIASRIKQKNQKLIIRLHRYELYNEKFMNKINWKNVDKLIFVNSELEKKFIETINPDVNTVTIPNAIDINEFIYTKPTDKNYLLAYSQSFNPIKAYDKLIITFSKLLMINANFKLTIAAKYPTNDIHIKNYNKCKELIKKNNLSKNIKLHIILNDNDIYSLLKSHNAIISYSKVESFHYSFAEGLLSGLEGFCNGWRELNPQLFWSNWCYDTEQDFIQSILDWGNSDIENRIKKSFINRKYIIDNFSIQKVSKIYLNLFNNLN